MLRITVPANELWDAEKSEFISTKEQTLQLEHSLVSLAKWESKWHKAFLGKREKTTEEILDYVRCMTLTQNVNPNVYRCLTNENVKAVVEYIKAPMTATYFSDNAKPNREVVTAEIIYYRMIAFGVPFECQKWHLNRLLTLLHVCDIKSQKPRQRSKREIMQHNTALNAARRKHLHTKG